MEGIQMVDLIGQHLKIENELREAMGRVLATGAFVKGPEVQAFAEELAEFTGSKHVIPCGNGTDALQIAMMALGIGPGDEVITTGFTFISTVEVVALLGAKPVLVDIDPDSFTIDAGQVEQAITERTKAIVPVHLFGQMANMTALAAISKSTTSRSLKTMPKQLVHNGPITPERCTNLEPLGSSVPRVFFLPKTSVAWGMAEP